MMLTTGSPRPEHLVVSFWVVKYNSTEILLSHANDQKIPLTQSGDDVWCLWPAISNSVSCFGPREEGFLLLDGYTPKCVSRSFSADDMTK